jgi:hypothetical protein
MVFANFISCLLIAAYFGWLCIQGWRLMKQTLSANSAQEILKNTLAKKQFYLRQAIICFIALALLAGVKALFILTGKFGAGVFTAVVFGTTSDQNLFDMIGWGGVLLALASAICWYQHLKSNHHLQVLYAFRKQLGLPELGDGKP